MIAISTSDVIIGIAYLLAITATCLCFLAIRSVFNLIESRRRVMHDVSDKQYYSAKDEDAPLTERKLIQQTPS